MLVKIKIRSLLLLPLLLALPFAAQGIVSAPLVPNPVIKFTGKEAVTQGGKNFIRYHLDVLN